METCPKPDNSPKSRYCNRTNFRTQFNFVYFVLLAESTKFSSIRKRYTYTSVSDTTIAVRKFLAYESWQTLEYEIFTRTKISAITVTKPLHTVNKNTPGKKKSRPSYLIAHAEKTSQGQLQYHASLEWDKVTNVLQDEESRAVILAVAQIWGNEGVL